MNLEMFLDTIFEKIIAFKIPIFRFVKDSFVFYRSLDNRLRRGGWLYLSDIFFKTGMRSSIALIQ